MSVVTRVAQVVGYWWCWWRYQWCSETHFRWWQQLGAVNGIGTRPRPGACRQIEISAGASRVVSAECTRASIPQQGIIGERGNRIAQVIDIGGAGGDIGCVLVNAVGIGSDISSVLIHFLHFVSNNWEPLTASVLSAAEVPAARLSDLAGAPSG